MRRYVMVLITVQRCSSSPPPHPPPSQHTNPAPEGITKGVGAITYAGTPSSETFFDPNVEFVQRYTNLTIPAGKAVRLLFVYSMNATSAGLDGQVATAEASIGAPPAISVTSLPNATHLRS